MLAFVLADGPPSLVPNWSEPCAHDGLVRVRTLLAGICNTDLELARGYMGFKGVLGHEFVGRALDGSFAEKRVVGGINFGCGSCDNCSMGLARHCPHRRVLGILGADGTLAEEFLIPERNLLEVPTCVSDAAAVFSEPLAAACEILEQLGSATGRRALVVGDGKLGPLAAQVLASDGADVTIEGRHLENLEWLADRGVFLGAGEGRYDVVVEATGSRDGLTRAIRACQPRGTLILKSTIAGLHEIDLSPIVIDEITLVGSRCGRMEDALKLLAGRRVEVEPIISARFPLREVERAFAVAGERGVRKVIVGGD